MAQTNVEMAEKPVIEEIKPLTYGELASALQSGINIFLSSHISSILQSFIKDHTTTAHIMSRLANNIHVDITPITNFLAPYTTLNDVAEAHFINNRWKAGDEFTPEGLRQRLHRDAKEKWADVVVKGDMDRKIFSAHAIRAFEAKQKRAHRAQMEEQKCILSLLTLPGLPAPKGPTDRSASRSRSRSATPAQNRSRSRSFSRGSNSGRKQQQQQQRRPRKPRKQRKQRPNNNDNNNNFRPNQRQGGQQRIPFACFFEEGRFSFFWNEVKWVWSDRDNRYNRAQQRGNNQQQQQQQRGPGGPRQGRGGANAPSGLASLGFAVRKN